MDRKQMECFRNPCMVPTGRPHKEVPWEVPWGRSPRGLHRGHRAHRVHRAHRDRHMDQRQRDLPKETKLHLQQRPPRQQLVHLQATDPLPRGPAPPALPGPLPSPAVLRVIGAAQSSDLPKTLHCPHPRTIVPVPSVALRRRLSRPMPMQIGWAVGQRPALEHCHRTVILQGPFQEPQGSPLPLVTGLRRHRWY